MTVGDLIDYLRDDIRLPTEFWEVFIVDTRHHPVGTCALSWILRSPRGVALSDVMKRDQTLVPVTMDQEEVALRFQKYALISAAVVDEDGRLVGQITVDDVVGVIQDESEEDMLALANVSDAGRDVGVTGIVRSRIGWLVLNIFTEALAVTAIAVFQDEVAKVVALAVLMPIISSVGGNAGTQTLAVAVRALANRELNAANAVRIFWRELGAGITNGVICALVMGLAVVAYYHDVRLALTAGLALVVDLTVAATGGILAPLVLERLGRDPAVSSSIIVTFLTDLMGFFSVLAIAALILLPGRP